jgi:hypothetical protein
MISVAVERVALRELVEKYQNRYIFESTVNPALFLKEKTFCRERENKNDL